MQIARIETIPVDVPIVPEFQIRGSLGSHVKSPFLLLRVHTDEGLTGLGEVSCTPAVERRGPGHGSIYDRQISRARIDG